MEDNVNASRPAEAPLESWKEIAAHLKRDVRTVKRWETGEGLPVRRHLHHARSTVYAYPSELDRWWAARRPAQDAAGVLPGVLNRWPVRALAFAAMLAMTLLTAGGGLVTPLSMAAGGTGIVVRQVWTGPGADTMGRVSVDGRFLSYTDWETGNLAVRDLTTGEKRLLTNDGSVSEISQWAEWSAVSPDSNQVVYVWWKNRSYELRVVGLDGSAPRTLHRSSEVYYFTSLAWLPDSKSLLATFLRTDRSNQIAMLSLVDGSVRVLKTFDWRVPGNLHVSPDGRWIVYSFAQAEDTTRGDIFLLATDGSREVRIIQHPADDGSAFWAPDGRSVLFLSDRGGTPGLWRVGVAEGKPLGTPELVKPDMGSIVPLGLTRDGSYYYGSRAGGNEIYLVAFDPVTGKAGSTPEPVAQRFVGTNVRPQWSPDGRFLAYISQRGGMRYLVIHSEETGEQREVLPGMPMSYFGASWSPDGRSFLMQSQDSKGRPAFYRVDAETGQTALLATMKATEYISFTRLLPDGKTVFYLVQDVDSKEEPRLMLKDLKTGEEKEVARGPFRPFARPGLALSPDGRQVAFGRVEGKSRSIFVLPVTGGEPRLVTRIEDESVSSLAWMPDGHALLFVRETGPGKKPELWRVSVEGGQPERLGLVMDSMLSLSVHPDGKRIAIGVVQRQGGEVWVMENFLPSVTAAK